MKANLSAILVKEKFVKKHKSCKYNYYCHYVILFKHEKKLGVFSSVKALICQKHHQSCKEGS